MASEFGDKVESFTPDRELYSGRFLSQPIGTERIRASLREGLQLFRYKDGRVVIETYGPEGSDSEQVHSGMDRFFDQMRVDLSYLGMTRWHEESILQSIGDGNLIAARELVSSIPSRENKYGRIFFPHLFLGLFKDFPRPFSKAFALDVALQLMKRGVRG